MHKKRIAALVGKLNESGVKWDAAFIFGRVNQYYFTGTMQDGVLVIKPDGGFGYFVRKSFARADMEISEIMQPHLHRMTRYSDIKDVLGGEFSDIYIETGTITYAIAERLGKYFPISKFLAVEPYISDLRAVKEAEELEIIRKSGELHNKLLTEIVPTVLTHGMTETELCGRLFSEALKLGCHGVSRFAMFQNETIIGQFGFGENSIYPTCFDGPGGMKGLCPAVPLIGDSNRRLQKGDIIFVDIGFGIDGYHTDKTQIYSFGAVQTDYVISAHKACIDIQTKVASALKTGAIPENIYTDVTNELDPAFKEDFMGLGDEAVKFLGHGVGLHIDELPVIAKGFKQPLKSGMVIAVEPKKSIRGVGIVGVEDTYIVTENGGECVTGGGRDIIIVNP